MVNYINIKLSIYQLVLTQKAIHAYLFIYITTKTIMVNQQIHQQQKINQNHKGKKNMNLERHRILHLHLGHLSDAFIQSDLQ